MANARSFLFPFRYSSRVAYVAEFSHQKIRLYAQGALVRDHGTGGDDDDDDDYFTDNIPDPQAAGENPAAAGENPADTNGTGAAVAAAESGAADADDTYGIKIEITDNGAGLVTAGGDEDYPVLEIESPYTYGDLWDGDELCCKLQVIQHSDVMYIFSENHPIMVLKRYANDNWQLEELELFLGPIVQHIKEIGDLRHFSALQMSFHQMAHVVGNIEIQALLIFKVVEKKPFGDTRPDSNVVGAGTLVVLTGKDFGGGVQDLLLFLIG